MNAIVLLSGGLDSACTSYYVKEKDPKKLLFLFIDYGQRALKEERYCAEEIAKRLNGKLKVIDLRWLGEISTAFLNKQGEYPKTKDEDLENIEKGRKEIVNWWVPCRNALFLLAALAHSESEFLAKKERYDVYIGLKSEGSIGFKDSSPEFIKEINRLVEVATNDGGYKIIAPLHDEDKDDVVSLGEKLKVPWEYTYSCYIGNGFNGKIPVHCGKCLNCKLRQKAFYWANVKDPSVYSY